MQSNGFFLKVYLEAFMRMNYIVAVMVRASPSQKRGVGLRKKKKKKNHIPSHSTLYPQPNQTSARAQW